MVNVYRSHPMIAVFASLLLPLSAMASTEGADPPPRVPCQPVAAGTIEIDGLQHDWEAVAQPAERAQTLVEGQYRYDWTGPIDASYRIWCAHSGDSLYLALAIRDNAVVGPERSRAGDELELAIELAPGEIMRARVPVHDLEGGLADPVFETPQHRSNTAIGRIAPRETGAFVELELSIGGVFEPVPFFVAYRDIDRDVEREQTAVISAAAFDRGRTETWGLLAFPYADQAVDQLLMSRGRTRSDLDFDLMSDVGGSSLRERVFVIGQELFVVGESLGDFDWSSADLGSGDRVLGYTVSAQDADGDGDHELFVEYRFDRFVAAIDGTVTYTFLAVYDLGPRGLDRVIWQELGRTRSGGEGYRARYAVDPSRKRVRVMRAEQAGEGAASWAAMAPLDEGGPRAAVVPWDSAASLDWIRRERGEWSADRAAP